jgi:hypothetical protein
MSSATWSAASHESLIGPPSELIDIEEFLRSARDSAAQDLPHEVAEDVVDMPQGSIARECRWAPCTQTIEPDVETAQV